MKHDRNTRESEGGPGARGRDGEQPVSDLQSSRSMALGWIRTVPERRRQHAAWAFVRTALYEYASIEYDRQKRSVRISPPEIAFGFSLDGPARKIARRIGEMVARLPVEQASYHLCCTYTALVPPATRTALGMYYTPPALTGRLLDMAEEAGIDWREARVLDPACGGGAFLLPVALRMCKALEDVPVDRRLRMIAERLSGFEIDPFAAWLTQAWLEIALDDLIEPGARLPSMVRVCDTLDQDRCEPLFDLVVGNPPYGRVSLTSDRRRRFARGLYGHANLYGMFTDVALRWTKPRGVIAFVTPTSFLAGEYFKALRALLATEAPPDAIDFIDARRGVFDDVLQETLLATYRRAGRVNGTKVHYLAVSSESAAEIGHAGHFTVPGTCSGPWLAPRRPEHQELVDRMVTMPHRLDDWGYRVSTGPLVWNRHKEQLRDALGRNVFPLIWAEAVTSTGNFVHRAHKRNRQPYFWTDRGDEWLKVTAPCVLVQRTTAKEQHRRLIAAELPLSFIRKHGAVVVENHLNMVRAKSGERAKVSTAALTALLNSTVVDEAFRCISGSVAVSAFELEALPLPPPEKMIRIEKLLSRGACRSELEAHFRRFYLPKARACCRD